MFSASKTRGSEGVRKGFARGVREGLTEGQFYERKGGAERRFFACAGRAVSKMGQGAAGSAISRERTCLERGRE